MHFLKELIGLHTWHKIRSLHARTDLGGFSIQRIQGIFLSLENQLEKLTDFDIWVVKLEEFLLSTAANAIRVLGMIQIKPRFFHQLTHAAPYLNIFSWLEKKFQPR